MLGNAVLRWFSQRPDYEVSGTVRQLHRLDALRERVPEAAFVDGIDATDLRALHQLFLDKKPEILINCIGVVKQLAGADEPVTAIPINALLPHRLARICGIHRTRLIHISTDCVFSGTRGGYTEEDEPDAADLYGRSKLMGEVDYPHAITLRTSIIGHELGRSHGLVGWFLSQEGPVRGFSRAIFSALPTVELARVIEQHVIPNPGLHGTYHVGGGSISKLDVLRLVGREYGRRDKLRPDDELVMDRSLNAERFQRATGYRPPEWSELVAQMREFG